VSMMNYSVPEAHRADMKSSMELVLFSLLPAFAHRDPKSAPPLMLGKATTPPNLSANKANKGEKNGVSGTTFAPYASLALVWIS
jgi:hypothetical protein